ncbi:MAG: glycosyltransferase family 4 protein [Thermoprotei archaeon]
MHHILPFGFKAGFNPLAAFGYLTAKPFVIGPILYPQQYTDYTDFSYVTGKGVTWSKLLYHAGKATLGFASKPLQQLQKSTLEEAEALVFTSKRTLELYKRAYANILDGKFLGVIPSGVERFFFVNSAPTRRSEFKILTVGRLIGRKGIQYLIMAMPTIVKALGKVKLEVVGNGPYRENLERLTKELSLEKYVLFRGDLPRHELPYVYAGCDLYVHPSLSEDFPSAISEAMAAGRAVVATDVGVIGEHIKDGVNGCLVPPRNTTALAEKIIDLLNDGDRRVKMGEEARRYAEENLDWDRLAEAWYKIYEMMVR